MRHTVEEKLYAIGIVMHISTILQYIIFLNLVKLHNTGCFLKFFAKIRRNSEKICNFALTIILHILFTIPYHECGTIPDPDLCQQVGANWSWWRLWSGEHCKKHDQQMIREVYANPRVVTLDKLPRIMDYAQ